MSEIAAGFFMNKIVTKKWGDQLPKTFVLAKLVCKLAPPIYSSLTSNPRRDRLHVGRPSGTIFLHNEVVIGSSSSYPLALVVLAFY